MVRRRETAEMKKSAKKSPKRVLRLPDLDFAKRAVLNTLGSPESKRAYEFAIDDFVAWYCSEPRLAFNKTVVLGYRLELEGRRLAPSTINLRLAAVRRLAYEAADTGLLSPELAAGVRRVRGAKRICVRLGNWLTAAQSRTLLQAPDAQNLKGRRDRAILALLLGCGLRRRRDSTTTISSRRKVAVRSCAMSSTTSRLARGLGDVQTDSSSAPTWSPCLHGGQRSSRWLLKR
jgi:integrase